MIRLWSSDEADPFARGRAYGTTWSAALASASAEYAELFDHSGVGESERRRVVDGCAEQTATHAPEVFAELEGVAEGAGLSLDEVVTLNARTEVLALLRPEGGECSTAVYLPAGAAGAEGGSPRTIQTWDWLDALSADTLVRSQPGAGGMRIVSFAEFGQVAKIGVNSSGLGVHFNILHHDSDGAGDGVPVHVVARMILDRATSVDDAVELARSVPLSASTVITVVTDGGRGTAPRAACIEMAPSGVAVLEAEPGRLLAHTNHFLDPGLACGEIELYASTTAERLACLDAHPDLVAVPDGLDRAMALGGIPDAPISMRPRPESPRHLQWASKATLVLDVASPALEFHEGGPAEVTRAGWRRVAP
ncbi:MAG: C45 family autoproteolytic acyltransferase/hydrolase [Pseudoclavibacter sp.]